MDWVTGATVIMGLKVVGPPATKVVTDFLGKIFAPTGDALGDALAHPIVQWQRRRVERANRLVREAAAHLEARGIEPRPVPARVLMPLLEKGSLEEDDGLGAKWAALLATAAGTDGSVPPGFVGILSNLSPTEARLLDAAYEYDKGNKVERMYPYTLAQGLDLDNTRTYVAIENIARLGLWRQTGNSISGREIVDLFEGRDTRIAEGYGDPADRHIVIDDRSDQYMFTTLGVVFLQACMPPDQLPAPMSDSENATWE